MFEFIVLTLFIAVPWALGYLSASYRAALIPTASLVAAIVSYISDPPDHNDEIDVLPGLWIVLSAIAVAVCLAATAIRRRGQPS